uniref:Uncharacterized protein n=1 Tax=Anguilla anguilla TaxID=7936 RepID=A0A0E9U360_ANGAN
MSVLELKMETLDVSKNRSPFTKKNSRTDMNQCNQKI